MVKFVNKNSEGTITGVDIHGRIEAFDQSVRSVESRLRAVERRLSYKAGGNGGEQGALKGYDIHDEIEALTGQIAILVRSVDEIKNTGKVNVLTEIERRISKLENVNKITIGKIKVPLELSGLIAALVLLVTGYLVFANEWGIIRSSYYPISIGIIFGAVVIAKFVMTNRETG